jgi:hypothetical protein
MKTQAQIERIWAAFGATRSLYFRLECSPPQNPGTDMHKHPPRRTYSRRNGKKNDGPDVL